jgi:hypothetical protein
MTRPAKEVRLLAQAANTADDAALLRLVGVLDELDVRGHLDSVLAPARSRLRWLRPTRPLRFVRLLFLPLDGAVVEAAEWRRGTPTLPRTALLPLAGAVLAGLGEAGQALAGRCLRHTTGETEAIAKLGAAIWPQAAALLPAAPPATWSETGLSAAEYAEMLALCRPVWRVGSAIWPALAAAEAGPPEELVRAALSAVAPAGPAAVAATLATLLLRATAPGAVAEIAASVAPAGRTVAVQALEEVLEQPPPPFAELEPEVAAEAAIDLAGRLDELAQCSLLEGERQSLLASSRNAADAACRASFAAAARDRLLLAVARLNTAETIGDAEVAALEEDARNLRILEMAGRKLGGEGAYDQVVRTMTRQLTTMLTQARPDGAGLRPVDIARCIEIIAGPEAAAQAMATARIAA